MLRIAERPGRVRDRLRIEFYVDPAWFQLCSYNIRGDMTRTVLKQNTGQSAETFCENDLLAQCWFIEDCWEQRENAGSLCQKFCCELPHRGTHRSHRRQSAMTCSADREPPA